MGLEIGTLADRPAPQPGLTNRLYWATDIYELFRDTGTTWDTLLEHTHDVMEEDMTQVADQNRIHVAASYRNAVMQLIEPKDMKAYWPLNDKNQYGRDLMRRYQVTAGKEVTVRKTGLVDFSADLGAGAYSLYPKDRGNINTDTLNESAETAIPLPPGRWKGFQFRTSQSTAQTIYVGAADIAPTDLATKAILSATSTPGGLVSGEYNHTVTFPSVVHESGDNLWVYMPTGTVKNASAQDLTGKVWNSTTSVWDALTTLVTKLDGADGGYSWSAEPSITIGCLVDIGMSPGNGRILSIQDDFGTDWAYLQVNTDKSLSAHMRNNDPTNYGLTGQELHEGFNYCVLTFTPSVAFRLFQNGILAASSVPSAGPLTAGNLNISIGAKVRPDGTFSNQLKDARVSDCWIANHDLSEANSNILYHSLVQGFPTEKSIVQA